MESEQGRKQLALKRTIGEHILEYGYCVYIDKVNTDMYPEQGPVWDWYHRNREQVLERLGASYGKESSGALRKIPEESMTSLRKIFEETGAIRRFEAMEEYGHTYSLEHGIDFGSGQNDAYFKSLYES
jgi:heterodisulfide reductase subunit C